jgi:hypothetical protein
MDKSKDRINEVGGTKDHVRDELDEAAERGRREGDDRKEAVPEEVGQGARTMFGRSGPNRKSVASQNSQFAKPGPELWALRVSFALMEFSEVRPPWVFAAHAVLHLAGRPTSGYRGRLACLTKVVGDLYEGETTCWQS